MQFEFVPSKRQDTLDQRGLDMANAAEVFEGDHLTVEDDRFDYGETRFIRSGSWLAGWSYSYGRDAAMHVASSA